MQLESQSTRDPSSPPLAPRRHAATRSWLRSIEYAMSWLVDEIVDGFAAFGEGMYPIFMEPPGHDADRRDPAERRHHHKRWRNQPPSPTRSPSEGLP